MPKHGRVLLQEGGAIIAVVCVANASLDADSVEMRMEFREWVQVQPLTDFAVTNTFGEKGQDLRLVRSEEDSRIIRFHVDSTIPPNG